MSYSGYASSVVSKKNDLNHVMINVNNLNFDGIWRSKASEKLLSSLDNIINKIKNETSNLQIFADAIRKIDKCIEIDGKIDKLNAAFSSIDTSTDEGAAEAAAIEAEISQLQREKEQIKNEIKSAISAFSGVDSSFSLSYSITGNFDYICDIKELESILKKCRVYLGNLANLYKDVQPNGLSGMEYINGQLDSILNNFDGREAAVNSVLMSLMLAGNKNVKYVYTNNGANMGVIPYNTNEQMVDGMDCCAYVSWAVNKGTAEPFHWEGVGGFQKLGDEIDISQSLPGDILVKGNPDGSSAHVMIIVANDPETGQITIAEAGGDSSDVHLVTHDYNYYRAYQARSLDDYYTGAKSNA